MEYYSAIKKNGILPFATTWMGLEGIMLSEINQTKTNTVWFHLSVESETNEQQQKHKPERLIDTENKQMVARGEEDGGLSEIGKGD